MLVRVVWAHGNDEHKHRASIMQKIHTLAEARRALSAIEKVCDEYGAAQNPNCEKVVEALAKMGKEWLTFKSAMSAVSLDDVWDGGTKRCLQSALKWEGAVSRMARAALSTTLQQKVEQLATIAKPHLEWHKGINRSAPWKEVNKVAAAFFDISFAKNFKRSFKSAQKELTLRTARQEQPKVRACSSGC